jgi:hypothetical protein
MGTVARVLRSVTAIISPKLALDRTLTHPQRFKCCCAPACTASCSGSCTASATIGFLASQVLMQTGNTVIVVGVVKQFGGVHIHGNLLAAVVFQLNKLHRLRSRPSAFSRIAGARLCSASAWRPRL